MKKKGNQSWIFNNISIISTGAIVGPKEGEGPLSSYFDLILEDNLAGEESWEKAESRIVKDTMELAIKKAELNVKDIDFVVSGDLLNQSIGSTFGVKSLNIPYIGIFGACSTMGEGMCIGSMMIDGEYANKVLIGASSHFCGAEKQFRFPLGLGTQRPPTSTWTVTGCGAVVLGKGEGPYINKCTIGKIIDLGITDANNMGSAMAPAAADTIINHFKDFNILPNYYDIIITGDLGVLGMELCKRLCLEEGYDISSNYTDCGVEIFDNEKQKTNCGGSGCACSATTFCSYYFNQLKKNQVNKILFVPTGALLSTTSAQQGESIPSIAHAVAIENS